MKRLKQEKNTETLRLRHEWKNQLLSLRMLQEKGDQEGLSARLRELDDELDHLTPGCIPTIWQSTPFCRRPPPRRTGRVSPLSVRSRCPGS